MRPLSLDYRRSDRSWHWTGIVVLVLTLAGAGWLMHYYRTLADEAQRLERLVARIERKLHPGRPLVPVTATEAQRQSLEVGYANDVLSRLNIPWDRLFATVEAASNDDVALLGIEPDVRKHRVKVSGEARDFDALLGYIRTLQGSQGLEAVVLAHHQILDKQPEKPVSFVLDASWTGKP